MLNISIITVCRNCATTLNTCIESVLNQSYPGIEYIVIDGASNDGTLDILQKFSTKLSVCISEPDDGIYDAMNKGIRHASGDIVGFLNSDDFYAHDAVLETVAKCFGDDPFLDACYSDLKYVGKFDISRNVRYWQSNSFVPGSFSRGWCPPHPTLFVRRSVYERFGDFDTSYRIAADVELMMRFLEVHKLRVEYIPKVFVKMRMGGTTNKNLYNILVQNHEVLHALRSHGLPADPVRFFAYKLLSRGIQFFNRSSV